jgi:hypothetical protein
MSYLSRREEELIETKRSQALALQILEVFTGQSTQDLHRLNLLSGLWQNVDKNILRTLDGAQGKEATAKLLCELNCVESPGVLADGGWNALRSNRRRDSGRVQGQGCGSTEEPKPVTSEPEPKPKQPEPIADERQPEPKPVAERLVSFTRPNGKPVSFVAKGPRKRGPFPTYAELLARKTPEQQAAFKAKRAELQRRMRERQKLAKAGLVPGS